MKIILHYYNNKKVEWKRKGRQIISVENTIVTKLKGSCILKEKLKLEERPIEMLDDFVKLKKKLSLI